jgi:hypothetical protein
MEWSHNDDIPAQEAVFASDDTSSACSYQRNHGFPS